MHPYLGTLIVACTLQQERHSTADGGMARLSLTFVETGTPLFPETFVNPRGTAAAASSSATTAGASSFNATVELEQAPGWVSESMAEQLVELNRALLSIDLSAGLFDEAAKFTLLVNAIGDLAVTVVRLGGFPLQLHDTLAALEAAFTSHEAALEAYLDVELFRSHQAGYVSSMGIQADRNALALEQLVRLEALAAAVRLAAQIEWESHEDALAARNLIAGRLDGLRAIADDETYLALLDLASALVQAVPNPEEALPHIELVSPRATTSSLLLAYRVHGDIGRELEVVARNDPPYPGFLRAGAALELLVDAG